jgi:hypothetical protein
MFFDGNVGRSLTEGVRRVESVRGEGTRVERVGGVVTDVGARVVKSMQDKPSRQPRERNAQPDNDEKDTVRIIGYYGEDGKLILLSPDDAPHLDAKA